MKNIVKKISVLFILVCCMFVLAACGSKDEEKVDKTVVLGTWVEVDADITSTFVINADGTYTDTSASSGAYAISMTDEGTYTYDGKEIIFTTSYGYEFGYSVSFDGDDMIWTNDRGYEGRYVKK